MKIEKENIDFGIEVFKKLSLKENISNNESSFITFIRGEEFNLIKKLNCLIEDIKLIFNEEKIKKENNVSFSFENELINYYKFIHQENELVFNIIQNINELSFIADDINTYTKIDCKKEFGFSQIENEIFLRNKNFNLATKELGKLNKATILKLSNLENTIIKKKLTEFDNIFNKFINGLTEVEVYILKLKKQNKGFFIDFLDFEESENIFDCFNDKSYLSLKDNSPTNQIIQEVEFNGIRFEGRQFDNIKASYSVKRKIGEDNEFISSSLEKLNIIQKEKIILPKKIKSKQDCLNEKPLNFNLISDFAKQKFDDAKEKAKEMFKSLKEGLFFSKKESNTNIKEEVKNNKLINKMKLTPPNFNKKN